MKPRPVAPVPRLALTREEAAAAIGVSLSHFQRHVQPELRLVYSGATRLVPVRELEAWTERVSTLAGGRQGARSYAGGNANKVAPATLERPGARPKEK